MKTYRTLGFLAALLALGSQAAQAQGTDPGGVFRCSGDRLNVDQAIVRVYWAKKCGYLDQVAANAHQTTDWLAGFFLYKNVAAKELRIYPRYPHFTLADGTNPMSYVPPVAGLTSYNATNHSFSEADAIAAAAPLACSVPAGYAMFGTCTSSCLTGDERILTETGYTPIIDAKAANLPNVVTLADSATLDQLDLALSPVSFYTTDIEPANQTIYEITTADGGFLKVTTEHTLLTGDGTVRAASTLGIGDLLVRSDGSQTAIIAKATQALFGRAYNLEPASTMPIGNLYVAEGFINGSWWFQNDGNDNLNRIILRRSLPDTITQ